MNARRRLSALSATLGLVTAGLTGLVLTPAASAFAPTLTDLDCPADVEPVTTRCAELTVPLDWQTPDDGRTTTIALRVIPSDRGSGGFTFNPGGPGGPGIDIGTDVYYELPARIRERFDFVMWDPRGVGLSGPRLSDCPAVPDADLPDTGPVQWERIWSGWAEQMGQSLAACFAANPDSAPFLGTWQVVRDLEAMRIALGYPRWNYWGMSYGTRIGYTYAKTFPNSIRTMIVDGSLWPQETLYRLGSQNAAAWNTAIQVYSSVIGRAQQGKLAEVLTALDDTVLETAAGPLTRWGVTDEVYGRLVVQRDLPGIRTTINALHETLFSTPSARSREELERLAQEITQAQQTPADPLEDYVFSFIHCADLHDRPTPETIGQVAARVARDYGTTLPVSTSNIVYCSGLPSNFSPGVTFAPSTIMLRTPPVVVLSTGDRATPWIWGRTMANQFAGSRTITYNSTQHVTYMQTPSRCVNAPVTRYVLRRELPTNNTFCSFVPSPLPQES